MIKNRTITSPVHASGPKFSFGTEPAKRGPDVREHAEVVSGDGRADAASWGVGLMYPILEAEFLAPEIKRFVIEAPRIARKRQAGQFVIVRVHAKGERIPLTIADGDPARGTITLIVQGVGKTTKLLNLLGKG